jgi:hypothetical protein
VASFVGSFTSSRETEEEETNQGGDGGGGGAIPGREERGVGQQLGKEGT